MNNYNLPNQHMALTDNLKDQSPEDLRAQIPMIKDSLRTLTRIIDLYGMKYWPLFERLEAELAFRESLNERLGKWRRA